jgi:hypothetical protein
MIFHSSQHVKSVLTFLTYGFRFGRLKASIGAACPNLPNVPNLFFTHPCGRAHTRTRAHARTRIVKTTNKVGKVRKVRTRRMDIDSQPSEPKQQVRTGRDRRFLLMVKGVKS